MRKKLIITAVLLAMVFAVVLPSVLPAMASSPRGASDYLGCWSGTFQTDASGIPPVAMYWNVHQRGPTIPWDPVDPNTLQVDTTLIKNQGTPSEYRITLHNQGPWTCDASTGAITLETVLDLHTLVPMTGPDTQMETILRTVYDVDATPASSPTQITGRVQQYLVFGPLFPEPGTLQDEGTLTLNKGGTVPVNARGRWSGDIHSQDSDGPWGLPSPGDGRYSLAFDAPASGPIASLQHVKIAQESPNPDAGIMEVYFPVVTATLNGNTIFITPALVFDTSMMGQMTINISLTGTIDPGRTQITNGIYLISTAMLGFSTQLDEGVWSAGAPTVISINPSSENKGRSVTVNMIGRDTHFGPSSRVEFISAKNGIIYKMTPTSILRTGDITIEASLDIPPNARGGLYDVRVITGTEVAIGRNLFTVHPIIKPINIPSRRIRQPSRRIAKPRLVP